MTNRKLSVILKASIVACSLLLSLFLLNQSGIDVICYGADAYDNDIDYVEVWQYNGSAWNLVKNFTSSGGSERIHDSYETAFIVGIRLNSTLASSVSQAIEYTRVFMNITDGGTVWNNVELNNTSCSLVGSYYRLRETGNWTTSLPVAGVTYTCSIEYRQYY